MVKAVIAILLLHITSLVHSLEVLNTWPVPSYALTKDSNDFKQLVDGEQHRYPIWVHRDSVGWFNYSPVRIQLKNSAHLSNKSIKIYTAVGHHAGVMVIERADVYTAKTAKSRYRHAGSVIPNIGSLNRGSYNFEIPTNSLDEIIEIILHVKSGGIYIDEIELVDNDKPSNDTANKIQPEYTIKSTQLVKDSSARLEESLSKLYKAGSPIKTTVKSGWSVERVDCFDKKLKALDSQKTPFNLYAEPRLKLRGQLCIKIEASENQTVMINADAPLVAYKIHDQLLRNGEKIHDALLIVNNSKITINGNKPEYLWLDFSSSASSENNVNAQIVLTMQGDKKILPINLQKVSCDQLVDSMDLTVWAYSKNSPIWNNENKQKIADLLISEGVSNITVHPNYLPNIKAAKQWTKSQKQALAGELELYKSDSLNYLLITSWKSGRNYFVDENGFFTERSKTDFKIWLEQLNIFLSEYQINQQQIVLYLIDEPSGDKLYDLKQFSALLQSQNSKLGLYANPTNARRGAATRSDLEYLKTTVSLWQPLWAFLKTADNLAFYKQLQKPWVIYDLPEYPAKAAEPDRFYRGLAWRAWSVGASGTGVWSFDDTTRSSAFDDFDGSRSDWAMVYESETQGFHPSRRWYAMLRGIEDVRLSPYWSNQFSLKTDIFNGNTINKDDLFINAIQACSGSGNITEPSPPTIDAVIIK